ncbi:MAG: GPI anchored serine-threonine rich family protein [Candidatus Omnitrophica bacterium]|nr:GPI anchored serine-threonine rich family protein [Candidatus Omnitrophota bacterium]
MIKRILIFSLGLVFILSYIIFAEEIKGIKAQSSKPATQQTQQIKAQSPKPTTPQSKEITGIKVQLPQPTAPQTKQIRLSAPNGGEKWIRGQTQTIRWSASGIQEGYTISLVKGTRVLGVIADNVDSRQTSYSWKVGDPLVGGIHYDIGNDYKIMVRTKSGDVTDVSDRPFTISELSPQVGKKTVTSPVIPQGSIRILSPNGGETFYTGEYMTVRYETSGAIQEVGFWLSEKRGDGSYFDHEYYKQTPPTGQYLLKIPDIVHPDYPDKHYVIRMFGEIFKGSTRTIYAEDESDNFFFIKRGFDLVPKIDSQDVQIRRGNTWENVANVLTGGLYEFLVGSQVTEIRIKPKFTIKNIGHQWPTLPISILCKAYVQSNYPTGPILGQNTTYVSLSEYGGVAQGEITVEIPNSYRGFFTTVLEIDPDHVFEKDDFWGNNKDLKSGYIRD